MNSFFVQAGGVAIVLQGHRESVSLLRSCSLVALQAQSRYLDAHDAADPLRRFAGLQFELTVVKLACNAWATGFVRDVACLHR